MIYEKIIASIKNLYFYITLLCHGTYASITHYNPPNFKEQCAILSPRCNGKHYTVHSRV